MNSSRLLIAERKINLCQKIHNLKLNQIVLNCLIWLEYKLLQIGFCFSIVLSASDKTLTQDPSLTSITSLSSAIAPSPFKKV